MRALVLIALIAVGGAGPDRPVVPPRRDAAVTFRVTGAAAALIPQLDGGAAPGEMVMRWNTAGRLRLEAEGRPQVLLLDTGTLSAHIVDSTLRSAIALPIKQRDMDAILLTQATVSRLREDKVAGLACTVWQVHGRQGEGTICLTADGVPLRAEGTVDGKQGSMVATSVQLEPQPLGKFAVPAGYMSFSMPKFK